MKKLHLPFEEGVNSRGSGMSERGLPVCFFHDLRTSAQWAVGEGSGLSVFLVFRRQRTDRTIVLFFTAAPFLINTL